MTAGVWIRLRLPNRHSLIAVATGHMSAERMTTRFRPADLAQ